MNDQGEQIKKNFIEQWIRLAFVVLYIIVFGLLWRFIAVLLLVVIILQSLHRVIAAENNPTLLTFSEGLGNFLLKVLNYVLYLSDEKPIDFDSFFGHKEGDSISLEESAEESGEESAAKPEDVAVQPESEPEPEPETADEDSIETSAQSSDAADDVFADISFTDQADESVDDENEQDKKSD
ncbi:MAG: DUF4389 domain-containing protein [Gammaproteobacteria bacterium]|jgi:hypothetical protein|nr:DUF4389 domain-containing protein [Gammaproteobacteria bacterium]